MTYNENPLPKTGNNKTTSFAGQLRSHMFPALHSSTSHEEVMERSCQKSTTVKT